MILSVVMAELIEGKTRFYQVSEHFAISGISEPARARCLLCGRAL